MYKIVNNIIRVDILDYIAPQPVLHALTIAASLETFLQQQYIPISTIFLNAFLFIRSALRGRI